MENSLMPRYLTRGAQITGVATMSLCLTWISVLLRFYVRTRMQKFFGREDWLTLTAMILFTVLCSLLLRVTDYGLGAHMSAIPISQLEVGLKYIFACELLYVITVTVAKVSIGAYFLRLSARKYQVRVIYITLATVLIFSTMYSFFLLFQCSPILFIWTQYVEGYGTCVGRDTIANVAYAHAAMSAATDWSFGILPVFFVWKMKMDNRTKVSVILILSLGFFASSATIVRIIYIRQLQNTTDYSWFGINLVKWSMVEPAIGITAAAIATLRPLFVNFLSYSSSSFPRQRSNSPGRSGHPLSAKDVEEGRASRSSGGSSYDCSSEFAAMLGLPRTGVTTTVSVGKATKTPRSRNFFGKILTNESRGDRIELRKAEDKSDCEVSISGIEEGIVATTTVVING